MEPKLQITLLLVFNIFSIGYCIKCFQCNSAIEPECEFLTQNDTLYLKECDGYYEGHIPFCRKVQQIITDGERPKRILRSCGWLTYKNEDNCKTGDTDFILEKSCECHTNACNGSKQRFEENFVLLIITSIFVLKQLL